MSPLRLQFFQIVRKDNHGERTQPIVLAKVQILRALIAFLNTNYFSRDALSFVKLITCLIERNAGSSGQRRDQQCNQNSRYLLHAQMLVAVEGNRGKETEKT